MTLSRLAERGIVPGRGLASPVREVPAALLMAPEGTPILDVFAAHGGGNRKNLAGYGHDLEFQAHRVPHLQRAQHEAERSQADVGLAQIQRPAGRQAVAVALQGIRRLDLRFMSRHGDRQGGGRLCMCVRDADALHGNFRKFGRVQQCGAEHIVQGARFGIVGNLAGEIGAFLASLIAWSSDQKCRDRNGQGE